MYERARAREQERVIGKNRAREDVEEEDDPGEKEGKREREDRKRNRRSLARIISLFRALSFVESTWQYHCLSTKLKSLTPEYYSVKYPGACIPSMSRSVRFRTSVHRSYRPLAVPSRAGTRVTSHLSYRPISSAIDE